MPDKLTIEKILEPQPTAKQVENHRERGTEQPATFEQPKSEGEKKAERAQAQSPSRAASLPPLPAASTGVPIKEIERVLSEDLEDIYFQLPPEVQGRFKQTGEETARKIKQLLERTTVKVKKIAALIFAWLKIIPGVNKFFLEKESKIKTDEILKLKVKSLPRRQTG